MNCVFSLKKIKKTKKFIFQSNSINSCQSNILRCNGNTLAWMAQRLVLKETELGKPLTYLQWKLELSKFRDWC